MKQIKILLTLLSLLLAQPTFGMEKSVLFTVDLEKLLKLSDPGKSIILANNINLRLQDSKFQCVGLVD